MPLEIMDYTYLVTDICDKLSIALDLLVADGYFKECRDRREIYNKYLHPTAIDTNNPAMWKHLSDGDVIDVFQFNTQIGIETARQIKPTSPIEMTAANALLRLIAPEGQERPLTRYVRFKNNIELWYDEMEEAGLTAEEQKWLEPYYLPDYGVPSSQEVLMRCVMDEHLTHFTLAESNAIRKCLAKKKIKEIPIWEDKIKKQAPSENLGRYIWETMAKPQMSYSFSLNHALPYSFVGIQTLVLATLFPMIYWNTACLISNAGAAEANENDDEDVFNDTSEPHVYEEMEPFNEDEDDEDSSYDEDDSESGFPATIITTTEGKKKKKVKTTNYGRIATAIGKISATGVKIAPPDINNSTYTFSPDVKNNRIRYGLSGITRINEDLVKQIISGRPYTSINDFLSRIKLNKPQMINLIKAGAFDSFGDRVQIMHDYVDLISDAKKRITLQNMKMLIDFGLIPDEYDMERRVYNFNKYIKKLKLDSIYYGLDEIAFNFYSTNFSIDNLESAEETESGFKIKQVKWDKIYQSYMDKIRPWIQKNAADLLLKVNKKLTVDVWNKYCLGSVSKWEMDSISCYVGEHELARLCDYYEFADFNRLSETPTIDRMLYIKGKEVPIFRLERIAGTVLDRDKMKKTVNLLTTTGVVTVKVYGVFQQYDKQISERDANGKKHVIEKSAFARGNKIIVTGIRQDDSFIAKVYKSTPHHRIEIIECVNDDGTIITRNRGEE